VQKGELVAERKDVSDECRAIYLPRSSPDGSPHLGSDCLHKWVLDKGWVRVIMMAPIHEDLVSGAFIFDKGHDPFVEMKSTQDMQAYFEMLSPTSLCKLMTGDEAEQILAQPTFTLVSVRCDRLHVCNRVLLLGDSAHAVSASVEHGYNSALQDTQVFFNLLTQYKDNWKLWPCPPILALDWTIPMRSAIGQIIWCPERSGRSSSGCFEAFPKSYCPLGCLLDS
jgi:hypothetical protein